jgi:uncharacterized repeat protein (TIGR01451 family)
MGAYEVLYMPDLRVTKTASQSNPAPGQAITYTVAVRNAGAVNANSGVISDTLPSGLTLAGPITLDPPGAGTTGAPPVLAFGLTITAGQTITLTFPVTVSSSLADGTVITNTAAVTSAEVSTPVTGSVVITVAKLKIYLPLITKN